MGTFIDRDQAGNIVGAYFCPQRDGQEEVDNGHPELLAFQQQQRQALALRGQQLDAQIDACKDIDELKALLKTRLR